MAEVTSSSTAAAQQGGLEPGCELDLCFICDCTGSMGSYIRAAQENIIAIVERISSQHEAGVRFGLISYRDHPPQDSTYVTKCFSFTEDKSEMRQYVDTMRANGGGDGPEAVTAGLYEALHLPWRPNATKVCVLIADAPPHGLEPHGDGFPNGDPDGHDPLEIAREMVVQGITVYTVGCEPALGSYRFARDFFCTVAEITGGQAVALSSAALLAEVIIHGSAEELSLAKLQREVEEEVLRVQMGAHERGADISTSEAVHAVCANLHTRGIRTVQVETDGHMKNSTKRFWGSEATSARKSLACVKADLSAAYPSGGEFAMDSEESLDKLTARSSEISSASKMFGLPSKGTLRPSMFSKFMSAIGMAPAPATAKAAPRTSTRVYSPRCRSASLGSGSEAAESLEPSPVAERRPAAASSYAAKTDLISEDQVARIVQKAQYQKRL